MRVSLAFAMLVGPQLFLLGPVGHADTTYSGKVVSIADGDTLRILYRGGQLTIRPAEIATPKSIEP